MPVADMIHSAHGPLITVGSRHCQAVDPAVRHALTSAAANLDLRFFKFDC